MRFFTLSVSSVLVLFMVSCGGDHHSHQETHDHHSPADVSSSLKIELNEGKKWLMDDHTREMFSVMDNRLKGDVSGSELGKLLSSDLDKLIEGCRMTGPAHDQLHVYLMDFIPAVRALSERGDEQATHKVEKLLSEYPDYFE